MTRMTGPDCVVMCNLINTYIHTYIHTHFTSVLKGNTQQYGIRLVGELTPSPGYSEVMDFVHIDTTRPYP